MPLRRGTVSRLDRLSIAGVAWIFPFVASARVDRKYLYELVRASSLGHRA